MLFKYFILSLNYIESKLKQQYSLMVFYIQLICSPELIADLVNPQEMISISLSRA